MARTHKLAHPVEVGGKEIVEIEIPRPMKLREVAELQDAGEDIRKQVRVLSSFLGTDQETLMELASEDFVSLMEALAGEEKKPAR